MTPSTRTSIRLLALVALLACCCAIARSQPLVFAGGRVNVFPGSPTLIPVIAQGDTPPRVVRLRLDDGREIEGELVAIDAREPDADPRRPRPWLHEPHAWTASAAPPPADPRTPRLWRLLLEAPADAHGQGLWLEGRRIELVWRPDPWTLAPEDDRGAPWRSPNTPDWRNDPVFAELCEPDARSPARRWRWKLATGTLAPIGPADAGPPPPIESPEQLAAALTRPPLAERALEAYASSIESLWRLALVRLWRADPAIALAIRQRLAGAVDLAPGPVVPAYAPLSVSTQRLLDDLTDPDLRPARLATLARAWLADQPTAIVWAIDDAGPPTFDAALPTVGVVNLTPERQTMLTAIGAAALEPGIHTVPPRTLVPVRPAVPAPGHAAPSFAAARVRVGAQTSTIPLAAYPLDASPPGLLIGPLHRDWTLDEWRGGPASPGPPRDAVTTVLVHRDAGPQRLDNGGWRVFVECLTPEFSPEDAVTVWLGPYGLPSAAFRVSAEGRMTDPRRPGAAAIWVEVSRAPDRWSVQIDVPPDAIDDSGVLRISVERLDAFGLRTAAPRRMLPWQTEPGRLAIDTRAWKGL